MTTSQKASFENLKMQRFFGIDNAHSVLNKYTGIEARPYIAYLYYDDCGNFIGNSDEATVESLLEAAYIEVRDDGT